MGLIWGQASGLPPGMDGPYLAPSSQNSPKPQKCQILSNQYSLNILNNAKTLKVPERWV